MLSQLTIIGSTVRELAQQQAGEKQSENDQDK